MMKKLNVINNTNKIVTAKKQNQSTRMKRKQAEFINGAVSRDNKENCFDFSKSSKKCDQEMSSSINRVKRLRLSSISPNTVNFNSNTYSNMLASAAKQIYDTKKPNGTPNSFIKHKLMNKFEHLNENSSSLDSGIGSNLNEMGQFSPASFEIQLINATNKPQNVTIQQRPRLAKENYLQSLDDFSSDDNNSVSSDSELDDEPDMFKLFNDDSSDHEVETTEATIPIDDDDETQHYNNDLNNISCLNTSCTSNNSSFNFQARRCLFKTSPTPTQSTTNSTPKIPLADSTNSPTYRQITPISTFRQNSIIPNKSIDILEEDDEHVMSTLFDYSINSIEKSLEIFAKKRRERETVLNRINEIEDDDDDSDSESLKRTHDLIMKSLEIETNTTESNARLIGDRSRFHVLPCTTSIKHNDLNVIEPSTLTKALDGAFDSQIDELIVIDSRYPYEYEGGHIRNAKNIYTKEKLVDLFLTNRDEILEKSRKRTVIIFHCEFSSERGPNLLRFLRNQDRAANRDVYPKLYYPELYLLEGGYKAFYETHEEYCEPKTYKPMLHEDHVQDLKHFRAKTKTWETQHKHNFNSNLITSSGYKSSSLSKESHTNKFRHLGRLQRFPKSTLF